MTFTEIKNKLKVKNNHLVISNDLVGLQAVEAALTNVFGSEKVDLSQANIEAGETLLTITGSTSLFGSQEATATILIGEDEQGKITYSFTMDYPTFTIPEAERISISGAKVKIASAAGDTVEGGLADGTLHWQSFEIPAAAPLPEADGIWKLTTTGQNIDLSSPEQVAQLVGLDSLGGTLPAGLAELTSISVNELVIEFSRDKLYSITATVGLLDEWEVVPGILVLKTVQLIARESEPEAVGQSRRVKLLLAGTVDIGPVEVPISPESLEDGKTLEIKLNSEKGVSINDLADLLSFAGAPDLNNSLPEGLTQLTGITLTELGLTIDFDAKKLHHAVFALQSAGPWTLPDPNPFAVTNLSIHIDLTDPFDRKKRKIDGSLNGTAIIRSIPVTLNAAFNETLVLTGTLPDLTLSTLAAEWLGGSSLPQDLQEVSFSSVALILDPKKKSFNFSGKSIASWTLPFGDGSHETSELELHFLRDPESGTKCLLSMAHSGDLSISDEVSFHTIALGFDYKGKDDWGVVGSLKATAFNTTLDMQIGMKTEENVRTYLFKGILVMFPASLAGVASLNIFGLEVDASKDLSKPNAKYDWSVSLAGVLEIEGVANIDGKALVEKKGASTSFSFTSNDTHVDIPLSIPDRDANLVLTLNSISIKHASENAPWSFNCDVAAGLTGLPDTIQKYLPAQVEAQFTIDEDGTAITIPHLLPRVDFDVPDAEVCGVGIKMGTMAMELANFSFQKSKSHSPAFTFDLGVGLPAHLNDTFGVKEDGTPKTPIFNTYVPDNEDTITRFTVGLSADKEVIFRATTLPFGQGGKIEPTYTFDFNEFGQLSIDVPSLQYDGKSLAASGGFRQPDPKNHPLKIPLTPLKALLKAMTLELVARALPDGIPLKDLELVDNQGDFITGNLSGQLRGAFGNDIPGEVTSAIDTISNALDRLPDAFKNYFHAVIPNGFTFELGFTSEGNIHIQLNVETPEGEPPQAIKFLTFGVAGVIPAINGVQLYSLSLDSVAGDVLQLLRLDAIFEQFDILTLAASLVIPDSSVLPDPSKFVQRWSIRDLYMLFALAAGDVIPIPIFFDDLGIEFYNLFGLGGGLKVQFPMPSGGVGELAALASELKPFVTDADYLLPGDLFARHNLALNLGMNPAYLELPPYLGGKVLGSKGQVFQVDLSEPIVDVLNSLKKPNLGKLAQMIVTILPLQYRVGSGSYSLAGILNVQAAYLLTTPDEFSRLASPPVEATLDNLPVVWTPTTQGMILFLGGAASIGGLASLKAVFGLALTEAGFSTRVHVQGELSHLLLADLQGDMRITTKQIENASKQTAFELNGHSRICIFDHLFLRGDLQMDENHLFMDGAIQVFPDASPLQINGNGRLWIDREGNVSLQAGVGVSLLDFDLVGATLDVLRNNIEEHIRVTATWLGAQALFEMGDISDGHGGRTYQMIGSVSFPAPGKPALGLNLDTGPVYFPGTSLKLCDNIHIATSVTAGLEVTLSNRGFSAGVHASFSWNGSTWSVGFHIAASFASLEEFIQRIAQAIIDQVYDLFKTIWDDVTTWLKNVGSGIVDFAIQQVGPTLALGWGLTEQAALAALKEAQSSAEAISSALTEGYHLIKDQAAQLMKNAGFLAKDTAAALSAGYNLLADEASILLKQVGYGFTEIASALAAAYQLTAAQLATALKAADYAVDQIASGVRVVYNLAQQGVYRALKSAGFAIDEVQQGVQKAFSLTQQELAILIAGIGATAGEAARKIQAVYHLSYAALADALRSAGYAAQEVAGALKDVGKMARDTLAAVMTEAGYLALDVADSVKTLYNETAAGVTAALHAAGAAVRDVAVGVQAAFNLAPHFLAQVMKDAQYTAMAVAQGLKAAFNSAESAVASLLKEVGFAFNDVANSIKQVYFLTEACLAAALRGAGYAADQVAAGVKSIFNSAVKGLATALKFAGYAADEVAIGVNTIFNLATNAMAGVLKSIGYAANEVGAGLAAAYKLTESLLGNLMSTLGYTVSEVAGAMKAVFNLAEDALANAMRVAGYAYQQVAVGVQTVFNLGKEALAAVLKGMGYALNEVADGVRQALNLIEGELAIALKSVGYAIDQIAASIKSLYNLAAQGIATALRAASYAAEEVASLFTNFYQLAADEIGRLLSGAGYAASIVANVLKNAFNWAAEQTAQFFKGLLAYSAAQVIELLKAVDYVLDEVAAALKSVFNLLEKGLAEALKAAGTLAAEVAHLLTGLYQTAEEAIASILHSVGYALDEVAQVMKNVYHWLAGRMAQFLHDVLDIAAEVVTEVLKAASYVLQEIVAALNQVYQLFEEGLADILKKAGYVANEAADAFISVFGTIADLAARALMAAGYLASEVVGVLKDAYHWLAGQVAQFFHDVWGYSASVLAGLLKGASYLFDDIAASVKSVFNLIDQVLAQVLNSIGYVYGEVAAKVQKLYNLTKEGLARALKAAGYALEQVASGVKQVFSLIDRDLTAALQSAGYVFDEVVRGVQSVFNLGKQALANLLRGAGYLAEQVAIVLRDFFSDASAQVTAAVLRSAGYLVDETTAALQSVYTDAAEDVADALNYAGYAAGEVAGVLKDTFGWTASNVASFMKDTLGFGNEVINDALNKAHYAADEIGSAMSSAFGSAVDAVGDFFSDVGSEIGSWF